MNIIQKAKVFATAAHAAVGQKRKYTFEPYIVHPTEVAELVATVTSNADMIAAAWLHDVIEDTQITEETIRVEFGDEVADLVMWLTDVSKPDDGNRSTRKAIDLEHTKNASINAKTIKLADIISNVRSISEHDPEFAKIYLEEKRAQLAVLTEGNQTLYEFAYEMIYT